MENIEVLMPLNTVLTVKSASILRAVSKTCKYFIKVKNYSFYKIFKQLDLSVDSVIKMIFEADSHFLDHDHDELYYFPIKFHDFGDKLKEIVLDSKYYFCFQDFADILKNAGIGRTLNQIACDHCMIYTDYYPLQGLLIEMCVDRESW